MEYDAFLSFHGVEFGLMEGTDGLLIVKTGSGGTIYGHENKYLALASRIAERHNVSVIVSDNPLELAPEENMSITMSVAADYISSRKEEMPVFYFGVSKGGQYGAMYGYRYPFVQKWLLLNLPVMINWHKSKAGLMKMPTDQEVTSTSCGEKISSGLRSLMSAIHFRMRSMNFCGWRSDFCLTRNKIHEFWVNVPM